MTYEEYQNKRKSYMTSNASSKAKEKAIADLDAEFNATMLDKAKQEQLLEEIQTSSADIDDIIGEN